VIHSLKKVYAVSQVCRLAGVARSSYYAFVTPRERRCTPPEIIKAARLIHTKCRRSFGSRRMSQALRSKGHSVGRYRARSLMKQEQLVVAKRATHRYPKAKGELSRIAPNLLDRQFNPGAANEIWAGDITYLRTRQGWTYIAIVMDLYARRIVGWAYSNQPDTQLIIEALDQAIQARGSPKGVMFHSDQGSQYTSKLFVEKLEADGFVQSMSRKGNCWDNAVVERFFRSLKSEWIGEQIYESCEQARGDLAQFMDVFYNYERFHSAANDSPPVLHEAHYC
jgi:putative transposase